MIQALAILSSSFVFGLSSAATFGLLHGRWVRDAAASAAAVMMTSVPLWISHLGPGFHVLP